VKGAGRARPSHPSTFGDAGRVVHSVPDQRGHVYTKASAGGQARAGDALHYIAREGQHSEQDVALYAVDQDGELQRTEYADARAELEEAEHRYYQHLVFTLHREGGEAELDTERLVGEIAGKLREQHPEATVLLAVHTDTDKPHLHAVVGTDTTFQKRELAELRSYTFEQVQMQRDQQMQLERDPLAHEREQVLEQTREGDAASMARQPVLEWDD